MIRLRVWLENWKICISQHSISIHFHFSYQLPLVDIKVVSRDYLGHFSKRSKLKNEYIKIHKYVHKSVLICFTLIATFHRFTTLMVSNGYYPQCNSAISNGFWSWQAKTMIQIKAQYCVRISIKFVTFSRLNFSEIFFL